MKYAQTERSVLTQMRDHPFIVTLYFAFQTTEKLFLILDYCPGGDMGRFGLKKQSYLKTTKGFQKMWPELMQPRSCSRSSVCTSEASSTEISNLRTWCSTPRATRC